MDRARSDRPRAWAQVVGLPLALYLATTLGFVSTYSHWFYDRGQFSSHYDHGIYRFRVVGRELVLGVASVAGSLHVHVRTIALDFGRGVHGWAVFPGFEIVNGAALLGLSVLLWRQLRDPKAHLAIVALVVASGYVVTPYDDLNLLLTAATLTVVMSTWPWRWTAVLGLSVLGTANHEVFYVAVAAAVAVAWTEGGAAGRARCAAAAAAGWVGTYGVLRLVLAGGGHSLWQDAFPPVNHDVASDVTGWVIAALALAVVWSVLGGRRDPALGRFLLLASPYLVVVALTGIWFELPRLLMPVVVAGCLLVGREGRPDVRADAGVAVERGG